MLRRGTKEMQAKSFLRDAVKTIASCQKKVTKPLPTGKTRTFRSGAPSETDDGLLQLRDTTVYKMACITAAAWGEDVESAEASVLLSA